MNKGSTSAKHWAVLIGVNFYPKVEGESISVKDCLYGAVPDVQAMQQYLEDAPYPVDIAVLTATAPDDPTSIEPKEDPNFWPTRANVTQALMRVIDGAKKGDFVYIHFSGHGTKHTLDGSYSENVALVLFEDKKTYRSYLKGYNLRCCLIKMVENGLLVTMVLDCCFSGSVLRNTQAVGTFIRELKYDAAVDDAFPSEPWSSLFNHRHISRKSEVQENSPLNPEGYTILAACGLGERAHELQSSTGEFLGGLTQFLLQALTDLRRRNVQITQECLYNHVCSRFKAIWGAQTPRLYGNRGLSFFGGPQGNTDTLLIPLFWRKGDAGVRSLYLRAGDAHGVSKGDLYDAYPLGTDTGVSIQLRASVVHSLHSEMARSTLTPVDNIKDGWNAKLVCSKAEHKITIRITEEAYSYAKSSLEPDRLKFVRLHIGNRGKEACQFNVELNSIRQYCIYDGSMELLPHLEPLPIDQRSAGIHLLYILQRLASYKYLEGVGIDRIPRDPFQNREHTPGSFSNMFTLQACADALKANPEDLNGPFHIKHASCWSLKVDNRSNEALYLALFSFTSSWKIEDLTRPVGNNSYEEIPPKTTHGPIKLTMKVPEGQTSCKDVIKVFLTNRPTLFPTLNLDNNIMDYPKTRSDNETVLSGIGGASAFVTALTGRQRNATGLEQKGIEDEAWATQNYIIYTSLAS